MNNTILDESEVKQLIEYEAFNELLDVVDKQLLTRNSLYLFVEPSANEKHKRKKVLLFQKAKTLLAQNIK